MAEDFFVGYLPTPPGVRRKLFVAAACLAIGTAVLGLTIAATQQDPGTGKWNLAQLETFEGVLFERPYPMLRTEHGTLLLVSEGKRGAAALVEGMNGRRITLRGHTLARGSLHLLELDGTAPTLHLAHLSSTVSTLSAHSDTLTGEIIDPKCFSGAMKPGQGKTHKACATLCIRGGIPPVFLNTDGSTLLLVDETGNGLSGDALEMILPFVGDLVEVQGRTGTAGGLKTLFIQSATRR